MVNIQKKLDEEKFKTLTILQVHDELNFSVPDCELEKVKEMITHEMEHAFTLRVPLIVDCGIGNNWLEAH